MRRRLRRDKNNSYNDHGHSGGGGGGGGGGGDHSSVDTGQQSRFTVRSWSGPRGGSGSGSVGGSSERSRGGLRRRVRGRSQEHYPNNNRNNDYQHQPHHHSPKTITTTPTKNINTSSRRRRRSASRRSVSLPRLKSQAMVGRGGGKGDGGGRSGDRQYEEPVTATLSAVNDIEMLAQRKSAHTSETDKQIRVFPDFAYPNTRMNRDELKVEMNLPSAYYHNLRQRSRVDEEIGLFYLEILQCFGLPRFDYFKEPSSFVIAVIGSNAFKTDVMPPLVNPTWLSKMRRACTFPIYKAYETCHVGVFSQSSGSEDGFSGRIGLKISQFRPGSTYDVTLPLRLSTQVYSRQQRGSIRLRFHLYYHSESAAVWSYIPKRMPKLQPNEDVVVNCCDAKSFQNVARCVHGVDMQSKFSMSLVKALSREVQFQQVHILRYLPKREFHYLRTWKYPIISGYVFASWMHAVYYGSVRYLPGHIITYLLLHMWKNYGIYCLDGKYDNGFLAPTFEELLIALIKGDSDRKRSKRKMKRDSMNLSGTYMNGGGVDCKPESIHKPKIQPITMERTDPDFCKTALQDLQSDDEDKPATLEEIAKYFRHRMPTASRIHWLKVYENTFIGSEAVSFFIEEGYASDRSEGVKLGRKLAKTFKLFSHIAKKFEFEDSRDLVYRFLTLDTSDYEIKTHKPFAKGLFRKLNFRADPTLAREYAHIEFPFASAKDHPKFKVKDSLILRSKESRALLEKMEAEKEEREAVNAFGVERQRKKMKEDNHDFDNKEYRKYRKKKGIQDDDEEEEVEEADEHVAESDDDELSGATGATGRTFSTSSNSGHPPNVFKSNVLDPTVMIERRDSAESLEALIEKENDPRYEIKVFPKPPNQDLNARSKGGDKTMVEVLVATRHKMHQYCGHVFNDRAFKLEMPNKGFEIIHGSNSNLEVTQRNSRIGKLHDSVSTFDTGLDDEQQEQLYLSARKDEYFKLLHLGRYAHSNPFVSKIAEFVQPMLEMAQIGVFINRSLFNIFTWRDPILSFWIVNVGTLVVVASHCFPWRVFLGCFGFILLGPQNWVIRIAQEYSGRYKEPNYDVLIKKKKPKEEHALAPDEPLFSNIAPDNRIVRPGLLDGSNIRPVAVPVSPLMYNRFYDWPPEPEYTRVKAEGHPENDTETEEQLKLMYFDPADYTSAGIASSGMVKPLTRWMRARQMGKKAMKDVKKGVKKGVKKATTTVSSLK